MDKWRYDKIITGDDKRIKEGKPFPDIFILSAKDLNLKPENCIIFEDALSCIKAAIRSGARIVVAIPYPMQKNDVENIKCDKNKTK